MKMRMKKVSAPSILALALLSLTPVHGSGPDRVGHYDFSYQAAGDNRVRPVQVFDDGKSTFFQFRAGEPVPAIFAIQTAQTALYGLADDFQDGRVVDAALRNRIDQAADEIIDLLPAARGRVAESVG